MKLNKLALIALSVLLAIFALELGWRFYVANFGTDSQRIMYLYSRADIVAETSLIRPLPFVSYGLSPNHNEINSLGYRGPEIVLPKPPDTYRIVSLGGSTTYGYFVDSYDKAYPHQLQLELANEYGLSNIEVVNAGVPAYSTWETSVNFMLRVLDLEPDLVIVYHAVNDLVPRLVSPNAYSGGFEARGTWTLPDTELPASALQRLVMYKLGHPIQVEFGVHDYFGLPEGISRCSLATDTPEPQCRLLDIPVPDLFRTNPPTYFERNLNNIISIAQNLDIEVLMLTFAYSPYHYDTWFGDVMIHEILQQEVARHNEIVREVAAARSTLFYDLAEYMPIDRVYWYNGLHHTLAGTSEMARQIASYLVDTRAID